MTPVLALDINNSVDGVLDAVNHLLVDIGQEQEAFHYFNGCFLGLILLEIHTEGYAALDCFSLSIFEGRSHVAEKPRSV